jgi:hypothetical protein
LVLFGIFAISIDVHLIKIAIIDESGFRNCPTCIVQSNSNKRTYIGTKHANLYYETRSYDDEYQRRVLLLYLCGITITFKLVSSVEINSGFQRSGVFLQDIKSPIQVVTVPNIA